jgi:hypothetical protein
VLEGDLVTLDGSESWDPDGNDVFFLWTQSAGPDLLVQEIYGPHPRFFAPSVDSDTVVSFEMVAFDGQLQSQPDTVNITIQDVWDGGHDGDSGDTPVDIPDNDPVGLTSVIHVDTDRYILGTSVQVDITHTWIGDLVITLTSPSGTQVILHDREGGSTNDLHQTWQLLQFIGEMSGGDWTLHVMDLGNTDLGTLDSWSLHLDLVDEAACATPADCSLPGVAVHGCQGGLCTIVECSPGLGDCNAHLHDGCEFDVSADPANCGSCGNVCTLSNAVAGCQNSQCTVVDCLADFADCDTLASNGCEADLLTDANHCGACMNACELPHATSECQVGSCEFIACLTSFGDCDENLSNGCEADLLSDPVHCGGCGQVCDIPGAQPGCSQGVCAIAACLEGKGDCNDDPQDGCETSVLDDMDHCGACHQPCALPGAVSECSVGACLLIECDPGLGDCNTDPTDGCEVDLSGHPDHCGACDAGCSLPGTDASCDQGQCVPGDCLEGFADCNQDPADGCEVDINSDPDHCGACNQGCSFDNAQAGCQEGSCVIADCDTGYADCNGESGDGCEIETDSDPDHCGGCAEACDSGQSCSGGVCQTSCPDVDKDGHASASCGGDDCNDTRPDIHPDATETCNQTDDDCDGRIDEGGACDENLSGCGCASSRHSRPLTELLVLLGFLVMTHCRKRRPGTD